MKTIGQYYEYLFSKVYKFFKEKKYKVDGIQLRYLLKKKNESDRLIVVLSACTRKNIKARYNYMKTLKHCEENQLFILDDFGYDHRGAYYLGKEGGTEIEQACIRLIKEIQTKYKMKQLYFCGSSKGAFAALDLMTFFRGGVAIVGAPQYRLSDYLSSKGNEITGKYVLPQNEKQRKEMNFYLSDKLKNADIPSHKIYLHYSDSEHTYAEHICYLKDDLNTFGYSVKEQRLHYENHWDVAKYYPAFLCDELREENCKFNEKK